MTSQQRFWIDSFCFQPAAERWSRSAWLKIVLEAIRHRRGIMNIALTSNGKKNRSEKTKLARACKQQREGRATYCLTLRFVFFAECKGPGRKHKRSLWYISLPRLKLIIILHWSKYSKLSALVYPSIPVRRTPLQITQKISNVKFKKKPDKLRFSIFFL